MRPIKIRILETKERLDKLQDKYNNLVEQCDHPETYIDKQYWSGSYLDKASTTYYTHCKICDKILNEKTETHSWYE